MSAIIFDLDDTLYRERRWVLSGFAAVACHLERDYRLDAGVVFRSLAGSLRAGQRDNAFQRLCRHLSLSREVVPGLVRVFRTHRPRLRLAAPTRGLLARLRSTCRLAVVTNGLPAVQARKIEALGLRSLVDAVVYANDFGAGKPDPKPFLEAASRVGVEPAGCVFVGNDLWCDVYGARRVGMRTVRVRAYSESESCGPEADAVVEHLVDVGDVAAGWLGEERGRVDDDLRACG